MVLFLRPSKGDETNLISGLQLTRSHTGFGRSYIRPSRQDLYKRAQTRFGILRCAPSCKPASSSIRLSSRSVDQEVRRDANRTDKGAHTQRPGQHPTDLPPAVPVRDSLPGTTSPSAQTQSFGVAPAHWTLNKYRNSSCGEMIGFT